MIRIKARAPTGRAAVLPTVWGAVAVGYKFGCPLAQQNGLGARIVTSAVFFAVGTGLVLHVRRTLLKELRLARKVARTAQNVVLRPPPPRVDGIDIAAAQLSADRGASVGGDLYEALATEHGVRVVMGDVRGHGLAALGTVAALLGSFREAAHDEAGLDRVLRRLDRALARHLRERARAEHPAHGGTEPDTPVAEEFVTVLLLEIGPDGEVRALNCGHPWPYLLSGPTVGPLSHIDPLPPLGPFPLPAELTVRSCGRLLPGSPWCCSPTGRRRRGTRGGGSSRCRKCWRRRRGGSRSPRRRSCARSSAPSSTTRAAPPTTTWRSWCCATRASPGPGRRPRSPAPGSHPV